MIRLESLGLQKGHKRLLSDVDLSLHATWRVGLIGENGCGKSTFFELLENPELADEGHCQIPKDWKIAHLKQESTHSERKAIDFVIDGHEEYRHLEKQIADAQAQESHNRRLPELLEKFEAIDGYQIPSRAASLLSGLGFNDAQQQQASSAFSGGWRIRLNLAKTLMQPSDLLLLDEPTNHLDLDSILWLEKWLQGYQGTLLMVSHDREFLDMCVDHIIHFNQQQIKLYKGNYSQFENEKSNQENLQQAQYEKQQKQIQHMESFIRRFKAKATKAKQAQSRVKALERMEKVLPAHSSTAFSFEFRNHDRLPDPLLALRKAELGYESATILGDINIQVSPSSRIGILGLNGSGKSTLLKSLIGELAIKSGERFVHDKTLIGYFSQHQLEALNLDDTPFGHFLDLNKKTGINASDQEIKNFLGGFAFYGDRINENIQHFSGGEKSRLALALICWSKPNILILDEPTNHLDMEMRHALTLALQNFNGALVLVSHDRFLIRCTCNSLLLINQGNCQEYEGDIDNYSKLLVKDDHAPESSGDSNDINESASRKDKKREEAELRAKASPLRKELNALEKRLDKLNQDKSATEKQLADNEIYEEENKERLKKLLQKQSNTNRELEELEEKWLLLSGEIEAILAEK